MNIFTYKEYRPYLKAKIVALPKKGRGQIDRIANHLGVHQSFFSQVLAGKKTITEEQAIEVARYFDLTGIESEYLVTLVQLERTSHPSLVKIAEQRLSRLRKQLDTNSENAQLSEAERTVFYSNWIYSAIHLLTASPRFGTLSKIASQVGLPENEVKSILEFLAAAGLCSQTNGVYKIAKRRTMVSKDSPTLTRHHVNWRLKAVEHLQRSTHLPVSYTAPMIISEADGQKVKELIYELIQKVDALVDPSPSEKLFCLNVDFFDV